MFYSKRIFVFFCDDCGKNEEFSSIASFASVRKFGWAISKDYKKCYCPICAPKHRHTGRPSWFELYGRG